jgi:hypothetical protein
LTIIIACGYFAKDHLPFAHIHKDFYAFIPLQLEQATSIIEAVDNFSNIASYIDQNTLVLFDLDDTTFTAATYYGSIKFFVQMLNDQIAKGKLTTNEANMAIYPRWIESQKRASFKLTDERMLEHMNEIRKKGIMIYGFTARRPAISEVTLNQLNKLGVKFDLIEREFTKVYKNPLNDTIHHDSEARFEKGVVFCHEFNEKGTVFIDWYKWLKQHTGLNYTKVLLVDDNIKNHESMREAAKFLNLSYIGLHYKTKFLFETPS